MSRPLDEMDARILDWESEHPKPREGEAIAAARALGLTRTQWNQRLLRILPSRAALEHDPLTVYRLRRVVAGAGTSS